MADLREHFKSCSSPTQTYLQYHNVYVQQTSEGGVLP